ncbi:MAG: M48 family metallopeptidase [Syntrophomonadaceae bacterium]|nr:M48 family metallopeptidase [Syntrophomonadaceae bacterium]
MKIELNEDITINFTVTYSKRKTMAIKIDPSGEVSVAAPYRTSKQTILKMVNKKSGWLLKKLNEIAEINEQIKVKKFVDGEQFVYQGVNYPLQLMINEKLAKPVARICFGKLMVDVPAVDEAVIRSAIENWYRLMAEAYIKLRLQYFQALLNVKPNKVTIKNQKTRWGSCSSKGNLNFNWRIIMAPANVVDYLVIHELCHMTHPNHSKAFWDLVAKIMPDYKERKNWLNKNGPKLNF